MKLKLLLTVILVTTTHMRSKAQNDYTLIKPEILRLFYQYIASQSNVPHPAIKLESVTQNYFEVKVKDDYRRIKSIKNTSGPHLGRPDFQLKDTTRVISDADKELYELIYHD